MALETIVLGHGSLASQVCSSYRGRGGHHLQGQFLGSELELTLFVCEDPSKLTDSVLVLDLSETLSHPHCCKTCVFRAFWKKILNVREKKHVIKKKSERQPLPSAACAAASRLQTLPPLLLISLGRLQPKTGMLGPDPILLSKRPNCFENPHPEPSLPLSHLSQVPN